jgi:hypothetical protein
MAIILAAVYNSLEDSDIFTLDHLTAIQRIKSHLAWENLMGDNFMS